MQQNNPGGMDKRMLLAFALMIGIWIVYSQVMAPNSPPPQDDPVADDAYRSAPSDPVAGSTDTRQQESSDANQYSDPVTQSRPSLVGDFNPAGDKPTDIVVDGERVRAVFTTRGATLRSLTLKDFTDAEENPVELVQELPGALGLSIESPLGVIDLSGVVFNVAESWEVDSDRRIKVLRFTAESATGGTDGAPLRVERTYRIDANRYDMEMSVNIAGIANFRKDHSLAIRWERGIPNLETQEKMERGTKGSLALLADELIKDDFGGSRMQCGCGGGKASEGGERSYSGMVNWAGVKGKYFGALIVPETVIEGTVVASSNPENAEAGMRLVLPLQLEGETSYQFTVYAGPRDYQVLTELQDRIGHNVTRLVDFGPKLFAPISKAMHWFMVKAYPVIPNYGIIIIILSILIRLLFYPLNRKALQSQQAMQRLKPELDELNKKYKDDPETRTKKMMGLHKKHGVSPVSGCLPMLPQMPVIYALYGVMMNAIELRKAPCGLWIQDLSAPDKIAQIGSVPIHILPILMALTMFIQQKMTPTDPKQAPLMIMMPLMMVFFFYSLPSGLVLYWTITNIMMVGQQFLMKRNTPAVTTI
jgi:YidC/Oxa1 family membrane protein insertase